MKASTLVIFGATGDLTHRKLIPALFHLFSEKKLPTDFNIVGFAHREESREQHLEGLREALARFHEGFDSSLWQKFKNHLHYVQGEFENIQDYVKLAEYLKQFDPPGSCTNKIFYMATAPNFFPIIIENLESAQVFDLLGDCWKRIIVEKPFGSDLTTAKKLNQLLNSKFDEKEIYRIDHYLAKETVQNIIAFRFANGLFEPIWNKDHIDHIQITVAENFGVENRGGYYDKTGNLRDFMQNHLLQLLALTTMEAPKDFTTDSIRDSRLQALKKLRQYDQNEIKDNIVLGQYEGYQQEPKVDSNSTTDTFTAMKLFTDLEDFKNVPIYLRAGKNLPKRAAFINVFFKEVENSLISNELTVPNILTFHIQPKQTVEISIMVKEPGQELKMKPVNLLFDYDKSFNLEILDAYEKLLLDIIDGVQTFFPRADEVEVSWELIDSILEKRQKLELHTYKVGSWGPTEAEELLNKDGRTWVN